MKKYDLRITPNAIATMTSLVKIDQLFPSLKWGGGGKQTARRSLDTYVFAYGMKVGSLKGAKWWNAPTHKATEHITNVITCTKQGNPTASGEESASWPQDSSMNILCICVSWLIILRGGGGGQN
jgi:hypothetical protein